MKLDDFTLLPTLFAQLLFAAVKFVGRRKLGAQDFGGCFANNFLSTPAINALGSAIPTLDAKLRIGDDHGISHVFLQAGMITKLALLCFAFGDVPE
jgi:hypothetical protein